MQDARHPEANSEDPLCVTLQRPKSPRLADPAYPADTPPNPQEYPYPAYRMDTTPVNFFVTTDGRPCRIH